MKKSAMFSDRQEGKRVIAPLMKTVMADAAKPVSLKPAPVKGDQPPQAQAYYAQRKNQRRAGS